MENKQFSFSYIMDATDNKLVTGKCDISRKQFMYSLVEDIRNHEAKGLQEFYRGVLNADGNVVKYKAVSENLYNVYRKNLKSIVEAYGKSYNDAVSTLAYVSSKDKRFLKEFASQADCKGLKLKKLFFEESKYTPAVKDAFKSISKIYENFYHNSKEDLDGVIKTISENFNVLESGIRGSVMGKEDHLTYMQLIEKVENPTIEAREVTLEDASELLKTLDTNKKEKLTDLKTGKENAIKEYDYIFGKLDSMKMGEINADTVREVAKLEQALLHQLQEMALTDLYKYNHAIFLAEKAIESDRVTLLKAIYLTAPEAISKNSDIKLATSLVALTSSDKDGLAEIEHLIKLSETSVNLEACILEASVFAKNIDVENKLQSIHEGISDKVTGFLNKIKEFIQNIFNKCVEWFKKFGGISKEFIQKNMALMDKEFKAVSDLKMFNYDKAKPNLENANLINNVASKITADLQAINSGSKSVDDAIKELESSLVGNTEGESFKDKCKVFFFGSKEVEPYQIKDMKVLAEYCLNADNMIKLFESDKNKALADVDNLIKLVNAGMAKNEASYLYNDSLFLEDDANGGNTTNSGSTGNQNTSSTNNSGNANNNQQQKTMGDTNNNQSTSGTINDNPDKPKSNGEGQAYAKRVTSTVATLMSVRIAAAERFASDFYKLIKQHVKYYSNDNKDANSGDNQNQDGNQQQNQSDEKK